MKKILLLALCSLITFLASAQDFMMQGWYWDFFKQNNGTDRWAKHLERKALDLNQAGFTYMWIPPASRTSTTNDSTNGYNPRDLYDYGDNINGVPRPTMLGTRADLNSLISVFSANNIKTVADLVYNHRDGGKLEVNPAVKFYTDNLNSNKDPFPCDRLVLALPLGAQNPGANGAGDYYFKFSSKTGNYGSGNRYNLYMRTSQTSTYLGTVDETEPNGGGDCGQPFNVIQLGQDMRAYLGAYNSCNTDEFKLTIAAANMRNNGTTKDTLWIYMRPLEGGYADQRPYGLWSTARNANIVNEIMYMTYTDFTNLPSGKGAMNFENFRPNSANQATETLRGDQNSMLFFYDYDQNISGTANGLNDWTRWNWDSIGIRGFRWDAVKHFPTNYIAQLLNNLNANGINPGLIVGENYDGNPAVLKGWVDAVKSGMSAGALASIQPRVFDFSLRSALRDACDYAVDARNVFSSGVVDASGGSGLNVVTFINNHDFRSPSGWDAPVQNDPMLAYAYILTNNKVGLPCVFYPDYYGISIPNAPTVNLKSKIDALMSLHKKHILGANQVEYLNKEGSFYEGATGAYISGSKTNCLIYQIKGGASGKDVIVAINYGTTTLKVDHVINASGNPVGTKFYDQLGYSAFPFATVNAAGKIYIELPPRSYSVWVKDENILFPKLEAKVFLNHVNPSNNLMIDYMRTLGDFPLIDPYSSAPLNTKFIHVNSGDTAKTTLPVLAVTNNNSIVDWVFLELRTGTAPTTTVAYTRAALLQSDGDIVDTDGVSAVGFPNAAAGDYYVTIRHRNHLGFRTTNKITFSNSVKTTIDLTNASVLTYGVNPLVNITPTLLAMNSGDSNSDGSIDSVDSSIWEVQNGNFDIYSLLGDYNLDGSVDSTDSGFWEINNGKYEELD